MRKTTEEILAAAGDAVWEYAELRTADIKFSEEVVAACRANYCGNYNKSWRCPPHVGTLEELRAACLAYPEALVYTTKHAIEDSFDIEGMFRAKQEHDRVDERIRPVLPKGSRMLGAGACNVCKTCAFPKPCRYPDRARTSVEACGIHVVDLAAQTGVHYTNGTNTVTYFTLILLGKNEEGN